MKKPIK